ncbi:DNA methyltransferase [Aurantimonas sp. Leaf443]|uniref:site-specific DNA-methyltransferase n=1 Tax=Aurantimonas sp. Leaf443 TaxID=1736378 RepID=UPI0006FF8B7A|nr:DNA methyltransferase [Aurantimonas sp. Leaf443]KQT85669.1 DNA methyltransferase [Aurantimonas sp. Leaf443]
MSRLTELLAQAKNKDPALGQELEHEFKVLSSRRSFGLNFERHRPENVELPGRPIRKGDKVRILPPRATTAKGDQRLWKVLKLEGTGDKKTAQLELLDTAQSERQKIAVVDLIVVAEFKDFIYPGLISTGKVKHGGEKPFHTIINSENFHALEALTFTHRGKIDVIYIDPPYNSGAKDWKYNNDYVEKEDLYRHSKWLAMIERRLLIAKELLNPRNSVLIATIDEKEYLRLGLLLEQSFPEARIQMISSVINPKGVPRDGLSRVDEYIFVCLFGAAEVQGQIKEGSAGTEVRWRGLTRTGANGIRSKSPGAFYPILFDNSGRIAQVGEPLPLEKGPNDYTPPKGLHPVWPTPRPNGGDGRWSVVPETLRSLLKMGAVRVGKVNFEKNQFPIFYLTSEQLKAIEDGSLVVKGHNNHGTLRVYFKEDGGRRSAPRTVWDNVSHSASEHGSMLLREIIPGRNFPFPKSLYAVEDVLRLFVAENLSATVLDFFSGSGTTAHAIMRLNRQDDGRRQCISITNNEVAADEHAALRSQNLRPGDANWEKWGICDYITKPRIKAAITGKTSEGKDIAGYYKFTDEFPMSEGFEENAEFFTLTYETPVAVSHNRAFERIAPLLWMRAGSEGTRIENLPAQGWEVANTYGLLIDLDDAAAFVKAIKNSNGIRVAFIVTDDERRFQTIIRSMPDTIEPVRLYESYLTNFRFSMGR